MGGLLDLLKGPIDSLIGSVGQVIDDLHMSGEEKAKAKVELAKLQNDFNLKVMEADARFAEAQRDVIVAESQSESWITRNWRPITALTFTFIVAWNWIIAPIFSLPLTAIPGDLWEVLKIMIGGYVIGRSAEKVSDRFQKDQNE